MESNKMKMIFGWQGIARRISAIVSEGGKLNPDGNTPGFAYEPKGGSLVNMEVRSLRVAQGVLQAYLTRKGEAFDEKKAEMTMTGTGEALSGWHALNPDFDGILLPTLLSIEEGLERDRYWKGNKNQSQHNRR